MVGLILNTKQKTGRSFIKFHGKKRPEKKNKRSSSYISWHGLKYQVLHLLWSSLVHTDVLTHDMLVRTIVPLRREEDEEVEHRRGERWKVEEEKEDEYLG